VASPSIEIVMYTHLELQHQTEKNAGIRRQDQLQIESNAGLRQREDSR
jgi:hypothetical protein